jgi:hypothetical protein
MLFWAPRSDKLLVYADYTTGIYDLGSGRLVRLNPTAPWVFESTPILPDGKGFLAVHMGRPHREPGDELEIQVVTWDGRATPLTPGKSERPLQGQEDRPPLMGFAPVLISSRWEGGRATARWSHVRLEVHPAKHQVSFGQVEPGLAADGKVIQHRYQFPPEGAEVRLVELEPARRDELMEQFFVYPLYWARVEVRRPGEAEPRIVVARTDRCVLHPSPDGRLVAVRCALQVDEKDSYGRLRAGRLRRDLILVIDRHGEVVGRIVGPPAALPRWPGE